MPLLDEAVEMVSHYKGGYSNEFLGAENFTIALYEAINDLKRGDFSVFKKLWCWFAPTCDWDDFVNEPAGTILSNKIYEILNELRKDSGDFNFSSSNP